MAPSATLSSATLAVVILCSIDIGKAYVSPPSNRSLRRHHNVGMLDMACVDFDNAEDSNVIMNTVKKESKSNPPSNTSKPSPLNSSLSSNPYIRIQKRGRNYDVQTAITTFQKTNNDNGAKTTVDLHAQIHFGDASYFQYFNNDDTFSSSYDKILYELIVEDQFVNNLKQLIPSPGGSTQNNPIAPTQVDRNTASQYGLQCQVDGIQYCKDGWVHADLTREEFLECLEDGEQQQSENDKKQGMQQQEQPLWALASTSASYPGSELVTSLLRPTPSNSASVALTRRLFTNLFLEGDALSGFLRAILWFGVPSPELSIMLVDWSSLSYIGRQSRRRSSSTGDDGSDNNITPISQIAAPVIQSLLTGNWGTARRLVFGQILASGQSNSDTSKQGVLINKRNERAMDVLRESLPALEQDKADQTRIALLYGAGHCRDLHRRLIQDEGMTPMRTEWRTAFRATVARWEDFVDIDGLRLLPPSIEASMLKTVNSSTLESAATGLVILPLYLLIGGLDWVESLGDVGSSFECGMYFDATASLLLYLVRHVALYVGISKFVVNWGDSNGVFEEDDI